MAPRQPPTTWAAMYGAGVAGGDGAEAAVDEGDDGVEVGAGHGAEHPDQGDQGAGGGGGVLQQLEADVVG